MTIAELITFVLFLGFICWLAWQAFKLERKRYLELIKKEQEQTHLYRVLIAKLDELDGSSRGL